VRLGTPGVAERHGLDEGHESVEQFLVAVRRDEDAGLEGADLPAVAEGTQAQRLDGLVQVGVIEDQRG
jgi:hypothetical protein